MAVYDIKLTDQQFWDCTPQQFDELIERWILREEREDRRSAIVGVTIANANRSSKTKPFKIDDFMVHDLRGINLPKEQSWESQLAMVKALHGKFKQRKDVIQNKKG